MPYKLILTKDDKELITEHDSMVAAFDAGDPRLYEGYTVRVADEAGVVLYTQVLNSGRIQVFKGDPSADSAPPSIADSTGAGADGNATLKISAAAICLVLFFVALRVAAAYFND